jgi:hypothetical protein
MTTARKTSKTAAPARKPAARKSIAAKAAVKSPARPVAAAPAVRPPAARAAAPAPRADKPKKPKLVRDSFTIPKAEYMVLQDLKLRAASSGTAAKKSEILRAGVTALAAMNDAAFAAALRAVPPLKTGRPAKDKD